MNRSVNKFYLNLTVCLRMLVILSLCFSCSLFQHKSGNSSGKRSNPYLGVDFEEAKKLKLDSDSLKINSTDFENKNKKRVPVISFHFNPGKEDVFAFIGVLKALEQEGVKPRLLSGHGWGFILASLLAKFEKVNSLEWAMLKLSYKLKKKSIKLNSEEGLKELKKFAVNIFKGSRVEHLPITLVLPLWNDASKSFKLIKRGKVVDLFEKALAEDFQKVFRAKRQIYPDKALTRTGSDIPLSFNVASIRAKYYKQDQLKWNRLLKLQDEKFESSLRVFDISPALDSQIDNLSDYIKQGEQYGRKIQPKIRELLENWKN